MTDEEAAKFVEALQNGGTLCLPPGLYDQFIALPAGRTALGVGIKVVKSPMLAPDEVVVLAPAPAISSLPPVPLFAPHAFGDGFHELGVRSLPEFPAPFEDLLGKLLNGPLYVGQGPKTLAGNSGENADVTSAASHVLKGEGEER